MKNKKLFAILTLVCFMFTLMPVAAFASEAPAAGVPVYAYVDNTTRYVDTAADAVKVNVSTTGSFIVYATNDAGKLVKVVDADDKAAQKGKTVLVDLTSEDAKSFNIKFERAGVYTVALAPYASDNQVTKAANADYALSDAQVLEFLQGFEGVAAYNNVVTVGEVEDDVEVVITLNGAPSVAADGGFSALTGYVQVTNNGYGIPNVDVDLYTDSHGLQVTKIDTKTNAAGIMNFRVTGTIASGANTFNVYATYADDTDKKAVSVTSLGAATVTAAAEPTAPVNKGTTTDKMGIGFTFADANGATVGHGAVYNPADGSGQYKVTVIAAPTGYNKAASFSLSENVNENGHYTIVGPALNYEGEYTFQVSLKNGASATASVKVQKQGEPVGIIFVKAPTTVALNDQDCNVAPYSVMSIDANGVTASLPEGADLTYTVNGKAVKSFEGTTLKVSDKEDYIGSKITVLAVWKYNAKTFTAVNELTVVDTAAGITYVAAKAEVGVNSTLIAKVVDANGKVVDFDGAEVDVIILDKPANAIATATAEYKDAKDAAYVTFLASAAGEYKIQTIATLDGKYVSSIDTITVGAGEGTFKDIVVVSLGADKMIVNNEVVALDVAPFIENNRTMMQFNVLYVFGIDVKWVPETESIVAEGNGIKVVMNLGSKVAVVNGEEVALDVAPYSVNGRTVVPVGFITGVLNITPTFTYNADGSIADILFTK